VKGAAAAKLTALRSGARNDGGEARTGVGREEEEEGTLAPTAGNKEKNRKDSPQIQVLLFSSLIGGRVQFLRHHSLFFGRPSCGDLENVELILDHPIFASPLKDACAILKNKMAKSPQEFTGL